MSERHLGKRILIVDDTRTIPEVIKVYLLGNGFEYLVAKSGDEGLVRARADRPDVVISDIKMPGKDGFQLCRELKTDPRTRNIPVVLLTSLLDDEARLEGARAGADGFLNKPINAAELLEVVKALC